MREAIVIKHNDLQFKICAKMNSIDYKCKNLEHKNFFNHFNLTRIEKKCNMNIPNILKLYKNGIYFTKEMPYYRALVLNGKEPYYAYEATKEFGNLQCC